MELRIDEEMEQELMQRRHFTPAELCRAIHMDGFGIDYYPPEVARREHAGDRDYVVGGALTTRDEVSRLTLPRLDREFFSEGRRLLEEFGDEYAVFARTRLGPSYVLLNMGLEGFSYVLYEDPWIIQEVMRIYADWACELHQALCEIGFPVIWACDDLAFKTGPFFSPNVLRELFMPGMRRIADSIKAPWIFHSDGDLSPFLDDLVSLGMNGLHPIEQGAMDIADVKSRYGDRLCVIGNIDLHYTLTLGTPEETKREVLERILAVAPGGGYIVSSGNSITHYCKVENVRAMVRTIHEYGEYPIDLERVRREVRSSGR
jgi:hypothetical protein